MDMNARVEKFLDDLQDQGFSFKTEPRENRSKVWQGNAFRTTIRKGRTSRRFDTCLGVGWFSQTNIEAFRHIHETILGFPNYQTYEAWNKDQFGYYEKELGKPAAKALTEILGDALFETFYELDQE